MKGQLTGVTLLVSLTLGYQTIFGEQRPFQELKEAKKVIASSLTILGSMQKASQANNAKQSEAIKLASEALNTKLDAEQKKADDLLKQLAENSKQLKNAHNIAKARQLSDHQKQQIILPINIKGQLLSKQYDECMYTILSLFLSENDQNIVAGLTEANKTLRLKQLSHENINKRLRSAATDNEWNFIRLILRNPYAQQLIDSSAVNALFLFAVFNRNSNIINDILQMQVLADKLSQTTVSYAYTCAKMRNNSTLENALLTNTKTAQLCANNTQDIGIAGQSSKPNSDIERKNLEMASAAAGSSMFDDADLEVLAAHEGLFVF